MTETHQVVITGIGIVDCFGQDPGKSINSMRQGVSGINPITEDWAACLPESLCAPAAEVSLAGILSDPKQLKFMNAESRMAVAAAAQAISDAGLKNDPEKLNGIALYGATGLLSVDIGKVLPAMAASRDRDGNYSMDLLGSVGLRKVSPILPFHLLSNMPLCHVSIALGLTGTNAVAYPSAEDGWNLLRLAADSILSGKEKAALVGGFVRQCSLLPLGTAFVSRGSDRPLGDGAAFVLLESAAGARSRGIRVYCSLDKLQVEVDEDTGSQADLTEDTLVTEGTVGYLGAAAPVYRLALASHLAGSGDTKTKVHLAEYSQWFNESSDKVFKNSINCSARHTKPDRRVVITGAGVWSPIGCSWDMFKENLAGGSSGIDAISHFNASSFPVRIAGQASDVDLDEFDLPETTRAALKRDRKSAFGLAAAWQAMQAAFPDGINGAAPTPERRAAVMGAGLEVFHLEDLAMTREGELDLEEMKRRYLSRPTGSFMQMPADLGARLANDAWKAGGPVLTNVSACAASTQAIGQAYEMVRDGIADAALCGGYDSMINPLGVGGFAMLGALTEQNDLAACASRPFHRGRDGFVLGEGAGALMLEDIESAVARGARVYGEVIGYATTLDAWHLTDPHPDGTGAAEAFRRALSNTDVEPGDVSYINAHGTGTPKNDPVEAKAIRAVFGKEADRIPVSSTKSQIGHLISAAGAVEFLAGLQAFETGVLPATITLDDVDPECGLNHIAGTPLESSVDVFVKSSFGFGGQNAVLVCRRWEGL